MEYTNNPGEDGNNIPDAPNGTNGIFTYIYI